MKTLTTSAFGSLPVVSFQRRHADDDSCVLPEAYVIVFETAADAQKRFQELRKKKHLANVQLTNAMCR